MKKTPIGVVKMIKDPAIKCEIETDIKVLPVSPPCRASSITKNLNNVIENETSPTVNIHSIKNSYYNFYIQQNPMEKSEVTS